MTKEQRADALLCAAKHWQNRAPRYGCCCEATNEWHGDLCHGLEPKLATGKEVEPVRDGMGWNPDDWKEWTTLMASAALSAVAGMGYELENADGTPTEKVAEVEASAACQRADGTVFAFYKLRPVKPC